MPARPRRLRRALKWSGVAFGAITFAIWFVSRWFSAGIIRSDQGGSTQIACIQGGLYISWERAPGVARGSPRTWSKLRRNGLSDVDLDVGWTWAPHLDVGNGPLPPRFAFAHSLNLLLPLWIPFSLLSGPTAWLFLRDHRAARLAKQNACPHCSYPLSGLPPQSPCPECGKSATA